MARSRCGVIYSEHLLLSLFRVASKSHMLIRLAGQFAAARCPLEEAYLQEKRDSYYYSGSHFLP